MNAASFLVLELYIATYTESFILDNLFPHFDKRECNNYDGFKRILGELESPTDCTSLHNVGLRIIDAFASDSNINDDANKRYLCSQELVSQLAAKFSSVGSTPTRCHCSGSPSTWSEHHHLHGLGDGICNYHDSNYEGLYKFFFKDPGGQPCTTHHSYWTKIQKIRTDSAHVGCEFNLFSSMADSFNKEGSPCTCSQAQAKTTTNRRTTPITSPTTTPTSTSPTTTASPPTTTPTATSPTTSPTTTKSSTTASTLFNTSCSAVAVVTAVAHHDQLQNNQTTICSDGQAASSEALVLNNCAVGPLADWRRGINVMQNCDSIPPYTPIGTFVSEKYYTGGSLAGVFVKCEKDGFEMAIQECRTSALLIHLTIDGSFAKNANVYYTIRNMET